MKELTPGQVFAARMKDARASAEMSQEQLVERLAELGFDLKRQSIIEIEKGTRRVSIDEVLAIAAALGVAPVHMIVPFEKETVIREEAAEAGVFEPDSKLKVGKGLVLNPSVARAWIRGTALALDQTYPPLPEHYRFHCVEVPPPARYRLRKQVEHVLSHLEKVGKWGKPEMEPLPEEVVPAISVDDPSKPDNAGRLPLPLGLMIMFERRGES